jgi:WD40 repeat protein
MHDRLRIEENDGRTRFVWQVALVDHEQGVLVRTVARQQGPKTAEVSYWNLRTGRLELDPRGYPKAHTCPCFSPNGRYLLVRTRKDLHHVWDRATARTVAQLHVPQEYNYLHLSDDGQTVALAGESVAVWHVAMGKTRQLPSLKQGIHLLAPSGKRLIGPPAASVYDAEKGAKLFTVPVEGAFGTFSPDSRLFLHTYGHRAKLFDLEAGEKRESLVAPFEVIGGAVSRDHTRIAVGGIFEGVRVWEVPSEHVLATWQLRDRWMRRLCFSADGCRLVVASDYGAIRLWDVGAGAERACLVLFNDAWVTLTPDGYFVGSDNLADVAQFQADGRPVPFDRYAKKYDRPKRVEKALASSP